jgi:hypothetical protein
MIGAVPDKKERRGASRYDAVIATLVEFLALCVSDYTALHATPTGARSGLADPPIRSRDGPIRFILGNKGVGPAIIKQVIVKVDDQPVKNWAEVLEKFLGLDIIRVRRPT